MKVYSIFDKKAGNYEYVFLCASDIDSVRVIDSLVFSQTSQYNKYPEDFDLCCVGDFDASSGTLLPCKPRFVTCLQDRVVFAEVQRNLLRRKVQECEASSSEVSHE